MNYRLTSSSPQSIKERPMFTHRAIAMKIMTAEFIKSCRAPEQFPADRLEEIAFAGRSNVGKSSLINSLLHRKSLAKVSKTPGKTQAINYFLIGTMPASRLYF